MKNIRIATRAEWIKVKGLGLILAAIVLGFLASALSFVGKVIFTINGGFTQGGNINLYEDNILDSYKFFALFLLLLLIIVVASRICQVDHKNGGWLLMETQPVTKLNIYLAKYINIVFLIFVSIVSFFLWSYFFIGLSQFFVPEESLTTNFNVVWHVQLFVKMFLSSLGTASFMLFISMFITSYIWPVIIGVIGILVNLYAAIKGENINYSPFFMEQLAFSDSNIRQLNSFIGFAEYLSLFWAVFFLVLGYFWFKEKSFKRAFISNIKVISRTAILLVFFGGLYYLITKPKTAEVLDDKVRISGMITGKNIPEEIFISDSQLGSVEQKTVMVKDGKFSWEGELLPGFYTLYGLNRKFSAPLVVIKGGSYDFEFFYDDFKSQVFSRNNMKAELESFSTSVIPEVNGLAYNLSKDPSRFYAELTKYWKEVPERLDAFSTNENFGLHEDFKKFKLQAEAVNLLQIIKGYEKDKDSKFEAPQELILELKKVIERPLPLTLKTRAYSDYKMAELQNENTENFEEIKKLKAGLEKDQLLINYISKSLDNAKSIEAGEDLVQKLSGEFSDPKLKEVVSLKLQKLKAEKRGLPFPEMTFKDVKGKTVKISDFKERFVILEFWSTENEESINSKAILNNQLNYLWGYRDFVFLSVNLSNKKADWEKYLSENKSSTKIKDLIWADGASIDEILPKYVIVDPESNIYTFDAPYPGTDAFVSLLEKLVSLSN